MKRKKFTLIELIAVIVILGIVSVIAIPKYVNMQEEAADSAAQGVFGAAQAAAALNYAKGAVGQDGHTAITTGQTLLAAMTVNSNAAQAWAKNNDDTGIEATINGSVYTITVTTGEAAPTETTNGSMAILTLGEDL